MVKSNNPIPRKYKELRELHSKLAQLLDDAQKCRAADGLQRQLANALGVQESYVSNLLACRKVTETTYRLALALATETGIRDPEKEPGVVRIAQLLKDERVHAQRKALTQASAASGPQEVFQRLEYGTAAVLQAAEGFVGRASELARLDSRSKKNVHVVSSVAGFGGVGKTALTCRYAESVSERFPHGMIFLDFQSYSDHGTAGTSPDQALTTLLVDACGIDRKQVASMDYQKRFETWHKRVDGRKILFIWDNIATIDQVTPLLAGGANGLTLITTRDRIPLPTGAAHIDLEVMNPADAANLFVHIAGDDNCPDDTVVEKVVEQCAFMPVLIKIKAADVATGITTVSQLADDLAQLPAPDVKQGLYQSLDASYRTLTADQQETYRILGSHPGRYLTADTCAAAIAARHDIQPYTAAAFTALDSLEGLVSRGLAHHRPTGTEPQSVTQWAYTTHDVLLEHAHHTAISNGKHDHGNTLNSIADHYQERLTTYRDDGTDLPWLEAEQDALLTALTSATTHPAATTTFAHILGKTGNYATARTAYRHANSIYSEAEDRAGEADTVQGQGELAGLIGDYKSARANYEHARIMYIEVNNQIGETSALRGLAETARMTDDLDAARDWYEKSRAASVTVGDRAGEADAVWGLADVAGISGDYGIARDQYEQALAIFAEVEDRVGESSSIWGLAQISRLTGDLDAARDWYEKSRAASVTVGDRAGEAAAIWGLAETSREAADYETAQHLYEQALALSDDIGNPVGKAAAARGLASIAMGAGNFEIARDQYEHVLTTYIELGDKLGQAITTRRLADVAWATKDKKLAGTLYRQALALYPTYKSGEGAELREQMCKRGINLE